MVIMMLNINVIKEDFFGFENFINYFKLKLVLLLIIEAILCTL